MYLPVQLLNANKIKNKHNNISCFVIVNLYTPFSYVNNTEHMAFLFSFSTFNYKF
jgi:hypothetical protein